jgi:hypothetical protein
MVMSIKSIECEIDFGHDLNAENTGKEQGSCTLQGINMHLKDDC